MQTEVLCSQGLAAVFAHTDILPLETYPQALVVVKKEREWGEKERREKGWVRGALESPPDSLKWQGEVEPFSTPDWQQWQGLDPSSMVSTYLYPEPTSMRCTEGILV